MARWIALFEDDPNAGWVREKHDKDHFAYLAEHSAKIRIGGGLRDNPGEAFIGGLWVMEVATVVKPCSCVKAILISSWA